jgi:hypothetical protein
VKDGKMDQETLFKLYMLEREYQRRAFGDYRNNDSLNLASFIVFLETYLKRAKESYAENWTPNLPGWLEGCTESNDQGTAPVKTYEFIIKIMALAGAALETYTEINPDEWRRDGVKDKWLGDK